MPANRPWTVLVYIVADDDHEPRLENPSLDEIARSQLEALSVDALDTGTLVLSHVDFTDAAPQNCTFGEEPVDVEAVCRATKETNAASRSTLTSFFQRAAEEVANRSIENTRYAVVFWGHSDGPAGLFRDPSPSTLSPSLKLPDLRRALAVLGRPYVDLVIFQDCWMSSLEVAYELRDIVRFMIASQRIVRPMKLVWPWGALFEELTRDQSPNLEMLQSMVSILTGHYAAKGHADIPFSALTLDAAPSLAAPLTQFADALAGLEGHELTASHRLMETTLGGDEALLDVRRLCKRLRDANIVAQEALDLERVVNTLVVRNTAKPESGLTGVSLFRRPSDARVHNSVFARSVSLHSYNELAISNKTAWGEIAFEERFQPA